MKSVMRSWVLGLVGVLGMLMMGGVGGCLRGVSVGEGMGGGAVGEVPGKGTGSAEGVERMVRAAEEGRMGEVERLLEGDGGLVRAVVPAGGEHGGWPVLMVAARYGHGGTVGLLLEKGAEVDGRNGEGETALHCAAGYGHRGVAEVLIKRGADVNAVSGVGVTPLGRAVKGGHGEVVGMLREMGGREE